MKTHLLLLALLLAMLPSGRAQDYEYPPEIKILNYWDQHYDHRDGYQEWHYPDYIRRGLGFIENYNLTAYYRYSGGIITNYAGYHTAEGDQYGGWNNYNYSTNATFWNGPCPATATQIYAWTNISAAWDGSYVYTNADLSVNVDTNYTWEPYWGGRHVSTQDAWPWTLIFDWGPPHTGYREQGTNYQHTRTTFELFTGGVTNATNDVTLQVNVWAYDNLRQRFLEGNEIQAKARSLNSPNNSYLTPGMWTPASGPTPLQFDTNGNAYFLAADNERYELTFAFTPTTALPTNVPPGATEDISFWAYSARYHVRVGVDKNRDGSIDLDGTNDLTTAATPYVFWVNNDNDDFDGIMSDYVDAGGPSDYERNVIHNARDLEDYDRIAIRLPDCIFQNNQYWQLEIKSTVPIKLFHATTDAKTHVTDGDYATNLLNHAWGIELPGSYLGECNPSAVLPDWWMWRARTNGSAVVYLLFKSGRAGQGPVTARLYQNGVLVGRGMTQVKLMDITDMHDHYTAGDTTAQGVVPRNHLPANWHLPAHWFGRRLHPFCPRMADGALGAPTFRGDCLQAPVVGWLQRAFRSVLLADRILPDSFPSGKFPAQRTPSLAFWRTSEQAAQKLECRDLQWSRKAVRPQHGQRGVRGSSSTIDSSWIYERSSHLRSDAGSARESLL